MDLKNLEELGLTHNESKVYIELLKLGETKTGEIVKKTSLHRAQIYDALESLKTKGLVSYVIKENIKYFKAETPEQILEFIKEKERNAKELIPKLNEIQNLNLNTQSVSVYEGIKGLKTAMNNMLKELNSNEHHYVFASGNMAPTMGAYYVQFQNIKKNKKVKTKVLYDEDFQKEKEIIRNTYGDIRFFRFSAFPTDTWIYKDKVLIVTYNANPPIAILITSQQTSDSYKKLFEGFWEKALP